MKESELISGLIDGELDPSEQASAIEQIAKSPSAKAQYESALYLKQMVRDKCVPVECDEVWCSCRKRLDQIDKAARAERFVGRYAWSICGAFLVLIVGAGMFNRVAGNAPVYAGDVAAMVGSMNPVEATSNRIKEWFSHKFGGNVVDIPSDRGFIVEQAASCVFQGRILARLLLRDEQGEMVLVVVSNTSEIAGVGDGAQRTICRGQINNLNVVTWTQGDHALLLMGNRDHDQLENAAALIRAE